ncbi:MAG: type II secretion system protein N [Pseudomonadota bacterium]
MAKIWLILVFLVVFVSGVVANTPLGFVLDRAALGMVTYERASGTVWRGTMTGVSAGGQDIGRIGLKAKPLSLLRGGLRYSGDVVGPAATGRGDVKLGFGRSIYIQDVIADVRLHALESLDPRLRTAPSSLSLSIRTLALNADMSCKAADGTLTTDLLTAVGAQWSWSGPKMDGEISCNNGLLQVTLRSQPGPDLVSADGQLGANGSFSAAARVTTTDTRLVSALETLRFRYQDGDYVYSIANSATAAPREALN